MSSFYDQIDLSLLCTRAEESGFDMQVLAVICNMYCARMFFQLEGYALESLPPLQGILAGCPFATFLVQVYPHGPVSRLQQDLGRTDLFLFIDEWVILNQESDPKNLVTRTVESSAP
eukprot:1638186-Pyramimonas_sp.AAC.1